MLVTFLWISVSITMPLLSRSLISYVEKSYVLPTSRGKTAAMAVGYVLMTMFEQWLFIAWQYRSKFLAESVRCMVVTAVYRKSLALSPMARKEFSVSKLTSMISLDVNRMMMASRFLTVILVVPIILGGAIGILIYNLGIASLAGVALIFVGLGISGGMATLVGMFRGRSIPFADKRVGILRETIQNLRIVKFYGWEDSFLKLVGHNRSKEAHYLKVLGALRSIMEAFLVSVPMFAGVMTFAVRIALGHDLAPALVFPSLSLFELFIPMTAIVTMGLSAVADAYKSIKRIQSLFDAEEDPGYIEHLPEDSSVAVEIESGYFSWNADDQDDAPAVLESIDNGSSIDVDLDVASIKDFSRKAALESSIPMGEATAGNGGDQEHGGAQSEKFPGLHNVNILAKRGEFILVMGGIGTGKTTLLSAMAGSTRKVSGSVRLRGRLSSCLDLWSQNATVRENVLFGRPYDKERYENTLRICGLLDDIGVLPNGDMTEIGERGITLSGGQRARISLARAVYDDGDVFLLDDILAAVDSRVSNYILNECILGALASKTRIMATHNLSLLSYADKVAFLDGKGNCTVDTVENLRTNVPAFAEFTRLAGKHVDRDEDGGDDADDSNKKDSSSQTKLENHDLGKLVEEEGRARGRVSGKIVAAFIKAGGGILGWGILPLAILLIATSATAQVMMSVFLSWWTGDKFSQSNGFYIGIYIAILVLFVVFNLMLNIVGAVFCYTSASVLHNKAVARIFRAPMSFFDATPLGRIMSRFTEDTQNLDTTMQMVMAMVLQQVGSLIAPMVTIFVYIPYVIAAIVPVFLFTTVFLNFYRKSAREIKRYDSLNRSAMFAHTSETFSGMSTILAYGRQQTFEERLYDRVDDMNSAFFLTVSNQSWLALRLMFTASIISFMTTILASERVFSLSASSVGLLISILDQVTRSLIMLMPYLADFENELNSVERLHEFGNRIPVEAPYEIPGTKPPPEWPSQGAIAFRDVELQYRPHLPNVLNHLSFETKPGEKIGICGRTGAGKSTVLTALFRINELTGGSITIDGIDISALGLRDLRSKLSIIPQEPVLFQGTIRSNLDPFHERTDVELWDALRRSGLVREQDVEKAAATVQRPASNDTVVGSDDVKNRHKFHLDEEVEGDGANFSLGERQLLTLARALVRRSKIIVLDEATASVDYETDQRVQHTIAREFTDCTIMCIAHRLKTILHYDRILVLEKGEVDSFDAPYTLYKKDGIFREMCLQYGITDDDF